MKHQQKNIPAIALLIGSAILLLSACGQTVPATTVEAPTPTSSAVLQIEPYTPTNTPRPVAALTPSLSSTPSMPRSTELGNIGWIWHTAVPVESLNHFWEIDYRAISITYGGGIWGITLNKQAGFTDQQVLVGATLPSEQIAQAWQQGLSVTSIAYGNNQWAVIVSRTEAYGPQELSITSHPPLDEINAQIRTGRSVTNVAYGDGTWVTISSKAADIHAQKLLVGSAYPQDEITRLQAAGLFVESLAYGDSTWVVVLSRTAMKQQRIESWPLEPKGQIIDLWETYEYMDIRLYYADGMWYVVGRK